MPIGSPAGEMWRYRPRFAVREETQRRMAEALAQIQQLDPDDPLYSQKAEQLLYGQQRQQGLSDAMSQYRARIAQEAGVQPTNLPEFDMVGALEGSMPPLPPIDVPLDEAVNSFGAIQGGPFGAGQPTAGQGVLSSPGGEQPQPQPQKKKKGLLGSITGAAGDIVGGLAGIMPSLPAAGIEAVQGDFSGAGKALAEPWKRIGEGAMEALAVPQQVVQPLVGHGVAAGRAALRGDIVGAAKHGALAAPFGSLALSASQTAGELGNLPGLGSLRPAGLLAEMGQEEYDAFMADPSIPASVKVAVNIGSDPTLYVGPGVLKAALQGTRAGRAALTGPRAISLPARGAVALAEGGGPRVGAGAVVGAAGATQLADTLGAPDEIQMAAPFAGAIAGGVGAGLNPQMLRRAGQGALGATKRAGQGALAQEAPVAGLTTNLPEGSQVYHGTQAEFEGLATRPTDYGMQGPGVYVSVMDESYLASMYAKLGNEGVGARVIPMEATRNLRLLEWQEPLTPDELVRVRKAVPPKLRKKFDERLAMQVDSNTSGVVEALSQIAPERTDPIWAMDQLRKAGWDGISSLPLGTATIFDPGTVLRSPFEKGNFINPEDYPDPLVSQAWRYVRNTGASDPDAVRQRFGIRPTSIPTKLDDQIAIARAGWHGRLWYNEMASGAAENISPQAVIEYSTLMGDTSRQANPLKNTLASLGAMKVYRDMLLDGEWMTADDLLAATPMERAAFDAEWTRRYWAEGLQSIMSASADLARKHYIEPLQQMGAQKSPAYAGNLREAYENIFSFASTNDRHQAKMNGLFMLTEEQVKPWGSFENLLEAAREERRAGKRPYKGKMPNTEAPALLTLSRGLGDGLAPKVNEYRYMEGVNLEAASRLGITPRDVQAAMWPTAMRLFGEYEVAGIDWLLGLKNIDEAIAMVSKKPLPATAAPARVWSDKRVQRLADEIKQLDRQLLDKGIDPYEYTSTFELVGQPRTPVGSRQYGYTPARELEEGLEKKFPIFSASFSPGSLAELSPEESLHLHRNLLKDERLFRPNEDGTYILRLFEDDGIPHRVVVPEKMATWEGGGEASMYIRVEVPTVEAAQRAAALMGKTFDQNAIGIFHPIVGAETEGFRLLLPDNFTADDQLRWSQTFAKHGVNDLDRALVGNVLTFPNWSGSGAEELADRIEAAVKELGLTGQLQTYSGQSALVEKESYDVILARGGSGAGRAGDSPGATGRPDLPTGDNPHSAAYREHVEAVVAERARHTPIEPSTPAGRELAQTASLVRYGPEGPIRGPASVRLSADDQAREAALRHAASAGLPPPNLTPVDYRPSVNKRIAQIFDELPDAPSDPAVRRAYGQFALEIEKQFDELPITVEWWTTDGTIIGPDKPGQPYRTAADAVADIRQNGHLFVYAGGEDHSLLSRAQNNKFRAIHDYYGHNLGGYDFERYGEENAWRMHSQMFSDDARRAMTTETRGQNSWVNESGANDLPDGSIRPDEEYLYPPQKAVLLPDEFVFPERFGAAAAADDVSMPAAASLTGRRAGQGTLGEVAKQAFGGTPVRMATQTAAGAAYGALNPGEDQSPLEGALTGGLTGIARGASVNPGVIRAGRNAAEELKRVLSATPEHVRGLNPPDGQDFLQMDPRELAIILKLDEPEFMSRLDELQTKWKNATLNANEKAERSHYIRKLRETYAERNDGISASWRLAPGTRERGVREEYQTLHGTLGSGHTPEHYLGKRAYKRLIELEKQASDVDLSMEERRAARARILEEFGGGNQPLKETDEEGLLGALVGSLRKLGFGDEQKAGVVPDDPYGYMDELEALNSARQNTSSTPAQPAVDTSAPANRTSEPNPFDTSGTKEKPDIPPGDYIHEAAGPGMTGGAPPKPPRPVSNQPIGSPDEPLRPENATQAPLDPNFGVPAVVTKKLQQNAVTRARVSEAALSLLNLPRTMVAQGDFSFLLRQGLILGLSHPKAYGGMWKTAFKAAMTQDKTKLRAIYDNIMADPNAALGKKLGLLDGIEVPGILQQADPKLRSEEYTSHFLTKWREHLPTERGNMLGLMKLRIDVFSKMHDDIIRRGGTDADIQNAANFIKIATGRGDLKAITEMGPWLNAFFFSPRFLASRLELPFQLTSATPEVRKAAGLALGGFLATQFTGLALLSLIPGVEVEHSPISSDFGKVKVGDQRWELWAGYQPLIRSAAQLVTGEKKSITTGRVNPVGADDVLASFVTNKLSPTGTLFLNALTGKQPYGDELYYGPGEGIYNFGYLLNQTMVPLFLQDVVKGYISNGPEGAALMGTSSFLGAGTQNIVPNTRALDRLATKLAEDNPGRYPNGATGYFDLLPADRKRIRDENPSQWKNYVQESGPTTQKLEAVREQVAAEIAALDRALISGSMPREKWAAEVSNKKQVVYDALQLLYADRPTLDPRGNQTPIDLYYQQLTDSRDPETGLPNWDLVNEWLEALPDSDRKLIEENTGLTGTPLTRMYSQAQKDYYAIPRYTGLTTTMSRRVDELLGLAANIAGSAERSKLLRAISRAAAEGGFDSSVTRNARRVAMGLLKENPARARWKKENPELAVFFERGRLSPAQIALIEGVVSEQEAA